MVDSNSNNTYGGMVYNPQTGQYQQKQNSTLTQEEYNRLVKQENPFSLALTETEILRGFCNHRSLDGTRDMLVRDTDGTVRCEVCGYRFTPIDVSTSPDDVQDSVNLIIDILQTIKLLFIDMPASAQREYFQIIPLIEKVPKLFKLAVDNFSKHENYNAWGYRGQNMGTMNLFNMLSGALNGGVPVGGNYYNAAPNYGAFGTPMPNTMGGGMMPNQQMMPNGMGGGMNPNFTMPNQQMMPAANMGGVPMPNPAYTMAGGYAPQTVGFQYGAPQQPEVPYSMDPNAAAQQTGTAVAAPASATTNGKEVTVNTQLKA